MTESDRGTEYLARHLAGETWVSIAQAVGLSYTRVQQLARKAGQVDVADPNDPDTLTLHELSGRMIHALGTAGFRRWSQFRDFTPAQVMALAEPPGLPGIGRVSAKILIERLRDRGLLRA